MKSTIVITIAAAIGSSVSASTITRKRTFSHRHHINTQKIDAASIAINSDEAYDPFLGLNQRKLQDEEEPSVPTYAPTDGDPKMPTYAPTDDPDATPAPVVPATPAPVASPVAAATDAPVAAPTAEQQTLTTETDEPEPDEEPEIDMSMPSVDTPDTEDIIAGANEIDNSADNLYYGASVATAVMGIVGGLWMMV